MAAPSFSATGVMTSSNFSAEPSARPPEMMIFAEVSSGRSESDSRSPTKVDSPGSAGTAASSTGAAAPPAPVAWNDAVRMVITFLASDEVTVWMALPA